jgi:hypothetical protein
MRVQWFAIVVSAVLGAALSGPPTSAAAAPGQSVPPIVLGATLAQRQEAARALVPLLKDVKAHAQPGATLKPGTVPDSPFAGTQTTLFAFTLSKRSVPVDPRVVTAMNRLLSWNIGAPAQEENAQLFDRWLIELEARSSGAMRLQGATGLCDVNCVVARMTTLNESWGSSPRNRADVRDELLLDALKVAVLAQ